MDSSVSRKLVYPELSTYRSIRLSNAPAENDMPPAGRVYAWETVVEGTMYINTKDSEGITRSYPLDHEVNEWQPPEAPASEVESIEFSPEDIVDGFLTIDRVQSISGVSFYTDSSKTEGLVVNVPTLVYSDSTKLDFRNVDSSEYENGGTVRFSTGIVYLYSEDATYFLGTASGSQVFDANNGRTQIIAAEAISGDLWISKSGINNLDENKLMKIIVDARDCEHYVAIDGEDVTNRVLVCYMNLGGEIVRVGNIIEIA